MIFSIALVAVTLSWDVPTLYTDGSPLPTDAISGYELYHEDQVIKVPSTSTAYVHETLSGTNCYSIATVTDIVGPPSEEICVEVPLESEAPSGLTVEVSVNVNVTVNQ